MTHKMLAPAEVVRDASQPNHKRIFAARLLKFVVKHKKNGQTVLWHPKIGRFLLKPTPMQLAP